jgi:four helix bundle protein
MDQYNTPQLMQERIKCFVVRIVKLTEKLPRTSAGFKIGGQVIDSAGSIGANYSEAQAARSKKEFVAICGIILKENKETTFWLNIIKEAELISNLTDMEELDKLIDESMQLEKIFAKIIISASKNIN